MTAPTAVDAATRAVLAAGLTWLYDTPQPDDAIANHHGYSVVVGERRYRFIGQGINWGPVVVVDVPDPQYEHRGHDRVVVNGLDGPAEMRRVADALAEMGHRVASQWNGSEGCETGSLGLADRPHPTLTAALRRYHDGCPTHGGVFCPGECRWLRDGLDRAVQPTWPTLPAPAPATARTPEDPSPAEIGDTMTVEPGEWTPLDEHGTEVYLYGDQPVTLAIQTAPEDPLATKLLGNATAQNAFQRAAMARALRMAIERLPADPDQVGAWLRDNALTDTAGPALVLIAARAELRALAAELAAKHRPDGDQAATTAEGEQP